jgi:hypothetical protein
VFLVSKVSFNADCIKIACKSMLSRECHHIQYILVFKGHNLAEYTISKVLQIANIVKIPQDDIFAALVIPMYGLCQGVNFYEIHQLSGTTDDWILEHVILCMVHHGLPHQVCIIFGCTVLF